MQHHRPSLLLPVLLLTGCSLYPLGHSKNGAYFGGQGTALAPRTYVPAQLQREDPILSVKFKAAKPSPVSP
ncbi:hypothetical protein [Prosthecobacter sp.]|uniref:hypothetical protein n=1 Tax=Prosthecobacter sp. TaxID=1965333 RepID=UPI00378312D9